LRSQNFKGADGITDKGADSVGSYDTVNRVQKGRKNLAIGPANEVIVGGFVTNASNGRDLVVIKYDSGGTKAWHNTYDGAGGIDFANAVAVDAVGNVYAAGGSRTGVAMSTLDGVTVKYDASGNLVWTARYDNGRPDEVTSLMIDRDGNPVVSGYTQQNTFDMFVVRYNQNVDPGAALQTTILWESRFDNPIFGSSEAVWDMGLVFGRDVMLTGTSYPANGVFSAYTMRFKGTCVEGARWDRDYSDVSGGQDQMVAMGSDYFGSPVVVGYTQVAGGKFAIEVIKYDSEPGGLLWSKRYESADGDSEPTAVAVDPSGNVFMVGYTTAAGGATQVLVQNYRPFTNTGRVAQTITFANPGARSAGTTLALGATSDSGLPITYTVVTGPAAVLGNGLVLQGAGSVTVRASQAGSGDFLPATPVEVTFSVSRSAQTISFNLPAKIKQVNGLWESFPLAGVASSGLPLTYEVVSGPATIIDGGLQLSGVGVVTVRASQIGNSSFDPAVSVDRTVTGEVVGTFTILNGFHVNWRDRSLLDVSDAASFANGEAQSVALGLTGNNATAGYVAGYVNGANGRDLYLTKYTHNIATSTAVQSWVRQVNGSANEDDEAAAVAVDGNGDVIVAGYLTRVETGGRDAYVAKYSSNGVQLWEYFYNGSDGGIDMGLTLALQGTDFVIVGGRAEGAGTGSDFFAAKLNATTGAAVWETEHNRGGTTSDIPARVAVGTDGGVVLAGISGAGNSADAWTIKLNGVDGSLRWGRVYNFANRPDAMRGLALDGANNVIVSGYSQGVNFDMYTAKYESETGSTIWDRRYDGTFNSSDAAWDVIVDRQGNVLATGTSYRAAGVRDGMTIKYNGLDGTVTWARRPFNNVGTTTENDENFSIALDGLGNLVVVGYTENPTTGVDYYVARHRNQKGGTDGEPIGEAVFDGYYAGNDRIYQVRMDPNGAVWMVGYTSTATGEKRPLVVRLAPGPAPTP
jgi:fibronectin-binding autotransporter adhesin